MVKTAGRVRARFVLVLRQCLSRQSAAGKHRQDDAGLLAGHGDRALDKALIESLLPAITA